MRHALLALVPAVLALNLLSQPGHSQGPPAPRSQAQAAREPGPPQAAADPAAIANPNIDMDGFLKIAQEAARHRATRRLSEEAFRKMSREPGVIVLDARSKEKFDLLHIRGAINLSFPDIDIPTLEKRLPDKDARILIYCNNNFRNADVPFAPKSPAASLNLSTYVTLYQYGYRNVYELGPRLDPKESNLPFESSLPATSR